MAVKTSDFGIIDYSTNGKDWCKIKRKKIHHSSFIILYKEDKLEFYQSLGIRQIINADTTLTRLGGSLMPEPVLAAMNEAAQSFVDMFELQHQVGRRLAELTHNEAAYVCTGASAGLFLAGLACMTGTDLKAIARLPSLASLKNEIIIHCAQRIPYDPAVRLAGAKLVEIGNALQTFPWEFEAAITERTAAVLYIAGEHLSFGALSLPETIEIAHAHGLPAIVDAAAQLPPSENLWYFTQDLDADLAIFSGGKDLRGPQASGLIVGRADLIAACAENGAPHQRLGRPMKVGKEEMVGLLAAVEWYLQQDHTARMAGFEATVRYWVDSFSDWPGVTARRDYPNEAGRPLPWALLKFDPAVTGLTATEIQQQLWDGDPRIAVSLAGPQGIHLAPDTVEPGEAEIITDQLKEILRQS
jgi:L-seryl-tRNA(Ser) seleniumtransferase